MRELFAALAILATAWSLFADPIVPTLPGTNTGSSGSRSAVVNSDGTVITPTNFLDANGLGQYKYLKVVPVTEFNSPSVPSFGFKYSGDGTNFQMLTSRTHYSDDGYGLFAPTIVWYKNRFWVEYDAGANVGSTVGASNIFGLANSSNLVDWVKVATVTNHSLLSTGSLFGGEFLVDDGRLYLYFTCGFPSHTYTYVTWPTNSSFTGWAAPVMVADYPGHHTWDPAVIRRGNTYYMALVDTGLRAVHLLTNSVSPTNTFHEFQTRISFGGNTNYGVEACQFLERGPNDYVLYVQATSPGFIGKCYYATSTNLVNWSDLSEVTENGPITDHGTTIKLEPAQQVMVSRLVEARKALAQDEEVYEVNQITNTGTLGPVRYFGGQSVALMRWQITAFAPGNNFSIGEEYTVAYFDLGQIVITGDPLARATNRGALPRVYGMVRPDDSTGFPDPSWRVSVVYTNGGVALKFFSNPSNPFVRWRVREKVDNLSNYLIAGATASTTFSTFFSLMNEGVFMDESGNLHSSLSTLNITSGVITNNGIAWLATNSAPNFTLPNGSIATISDGRFYVRTNNVWLLK